MLKEGYDVWEVTGQSMKEMREGQSENTNQKECEKVRGKMQVREGVCVGRLREDKCMCESAREDLVKKER